MVGGGGGGYFFFLCNLKFVPSTSPKLLNLKQDRPSKKRFFWSNPDKTEVITFLTDELEKLLSRDHIYTIS